MVAHCDDKGKAMFGHIGTVHLFKRGALGVCQRIKACAGLFRRAVHRQPLGRRQLARQIRMCLEHVESINGLRRAKHPAHGRMQALRRIMGAAQFQRPGSFRHPGRMLKHTAELRDKGVPLHLRRTHPALMWMMLRPMGRNISPPRTPHTFMPPHIFDKAAQCLHPPRPAHQTAMQTHRHHRRPAFDTFGIKRIKGIAQIGIELIACIEPLRRGKAHVVAIQRIRDDQLIALARLGPIGQIVIIGVTDPVKAQLRRQSHRVLRRAAGIPTLGRGTGHLRVQLNGGLHIGGLIGF
mmetsp:Transcript_18399/g.29789  ORF Transcript_18399/g.29789 Transcript_18399/m.29789 type:complete len:294 (+) Transcript_18399:2406-3287(+)